MFCFIGLDEDVEQEDMEPRVKSATTGDKLKPKSLVKDDNSNVKLVTDHKYTHEVHWMNFSAILTFHVLALYGVYLAFTSAKWQTNLFAFAMSRVTCWAMAAGCHRYWTHKAFKAKWPLKLFFVAFQSMAFQNSILIWVKSHRPHHKYNETDADPINPARNFFFAHVGWVITKKHPLVREKNQLIDYDDLLSDPFVTIQHKYYEAFALFFHIIVCCAIPVNLWNETMTNAFFSAWLRWAFVLNATWSINSISHRLGTKPYDRNMLATESELVSFLTGGEGYHNYHHVFPWDYKTSELANPWFSETTTFINLMAKIGLAYDLKSARPELVKKRVLRTGDGSHNLYGWSDKDLTEQDKLDAKIDYPEDNSDVKDYWGWDDTDISQEEKLLGAKIDYAKH